MKNFWKDLNQKECEVAELGSLDEEMVLLVELIGSILN